MHDHVKYIVIDDGGIELPVMFDPILSHKQMAGGLKIVGAGEVGLYPIDSSGAFDSGKVSVSCWGKSVTLGMESRGEVDAKLIERMINDV